MPVLFECTKPQGFTFFGQFIKRRNIGLKNEKIHILAENEAKNMAIRHMFEYKRLFKISVKVFFGVLKL